MSESAIGRERLADGASETSRDAAEALRRAADVAPLPVERMPGSLWLAFVGTTLATFLISIAYRIAIGDPQGFELDPSIFSKWYIWLDVLNCVLIAYLWVVVAFGRRGVLRDLAALRPSLDLDADTFHEEVRTIVSVSPTNALIAGTVGALLLYSMAAFDPGFWTGPRPDTVSFEMLFYGGRQAITGWFAGVALVSEIRATRGFAKLGTAHVKVDLLDLRPLQPFAHKGLRSAAMWMISSSLISLFWLSEAPAVSIGPIVLIVVVLSTWSFLSPLVPVHNAIVAEKNRILGRVREALRAETDPLRTLSGDANPHYANLVAYYNLIQGAREWPIETPTLLRLAAFAALGLGSWLGGAVVERLVDSAIR